MGKGAHAGPGLLFATAGQAMPEPTTDAGKPDGAAAGALGDAGLDDAVGSAPDPGASVATSRAAATTPPAAVRRILVVIVHHLAGDRFEAWTRDAASRFPASICFLACFAGREAGCSDVHRSCRKRACLGKPVKQFRLERYLFLRELDPGRWRFASGWSRRNLAHLHQQRPSRDRRHLPNERAGNTAGQPSQSGAVPRAPAAIEWSANQAAGLFAIRERTIGFQRTARFGLMPRSKSASPTWRYERPWLRSLLTSSATSRF